MTTTYFPLGALAQECIDGMAAFWEGMEAQIVNDAAWTVHGDIEEVDPTTGFVVGLTSGTPASGNGTNVGQMLSYGTNGLLNLRSGVYVNGREVRGKLYVPQPSTGSSNDGVPSSTYKDLLVTSYNAALTAAGVTFLDIYSRAHGESYPTQSVTPSTYWARLRSRQR